MEKISCFLLGSRVAGGKSRQLSGSVEQSLELSFRLGEDTKLTRQFVKTFSCTHYFHNLGVSAVSTFCFVMKCLHRNAMTSSVYNHYMTYLISMAVEVT